MYYAILLLFVPLFISLCLKKMKHGTDSNYIFFHILTSNLIMNTASLILYQKSIINMLSFSVSYLFQYGICCILCGFFSYELYSWIKYKEIYLYRKTTLFFMLIFINCFVYYSWLLGEAGRQSFDLFLYNLYTPVNTDVANFDIQLSAMLIFLLIMNTCTIYMFQKDSIWLYKLKKITIQNKQKQFARMVPVTFFVLTILYPVYCFHLEDAYAYYTTDSTLLEDHYVHPNEVTLTWPEKKRNLVYIFMESFESSSFSKELGGLNDANLLPYLSEHMKQGVSFFDQEEGLFGGMISMPQTNVTLSGMISALSGVNNQVPSALSEDPKVAVVPNIITLHDLLAKQGYKEYFIAGTNIEGYHIGPFHEAHGNTKATGWVEKIASGDLPKDYSVWWGYEDKKLYEFAQRELLEVSKQEEPFMYIINTNDTHRTGGYTDPSCPVTSYPYDIQNAIACADYMVHDFIEWIKQQPFYENTTLVIVGDHLAHQEDYTTTLNPQEDRRIFNLFLNSASPEQNVNTYHRKIWTGDLFPTVLSALGVEIEGNRLGLGTNAFSNVPTLIEQYGEAYIHNNLIGSDPYYVDEFLLP